MRVITLAAATVMPAAAHADELQSRVLAAARAMRPDAVTFRRTTVIERTGAPRKTLLERYDPRRPPAERWSLLAIDGRAPTAKEAAQSRKVEQGPVPSYAELAEWFGAPATRSDPAPGTVIYRFARLPAGVLKFGSHDASSDTQAEATINTKGATPFVEHVRFTSTAGFRMMMVVSIRSMLVTARYSMLPTGIAVPAGTNSVMTGSMLGKSGEMRVATSFGDFGPAR